MICQIRGERSYSSKVPVSPVMAIKERKNDVLRDGYSRLVRWTPPYLSKHVILGFLDKGQELNLMILVAPMILWNFIEPKLYIRSINLTLLHTKNALNSSCCKVSFVSRLFLVFLCTLHIILAPYSLLGFELQPLHRRSVQWHWMRPEILFGVMAERRFLPEEHKNMKTSLSPVTVPQPNSSSSGTLGVRFYFQINFRPYWKSRFNFELDFY